MWPLAVFITLLMSHLHPSTPTVPPQVRQLFPSARGLDVTWHSVVKINQSLYNEAPGMDLFRPDQRTPVTNFFLAGSYTKQVRKAAGCTIFSPASTVSASTMNGATLPSASPAVYLLFATVETLLD